MPAAAALAGGAGGLGALTGAEAAGGAASGAEAGAAQQGAVPQGLQGQAQPQAAKNNQNNQNNQKTGEKSGKDKQTAMQRNATAMGIVQNNPSMQAGRANLDNIKAGQADMLAKGAPSLEVKGGQQEAGSASQTVRANEELA
ncbi:MAG: hypothetical protein KDK66_06865 [Deltaproteobacteria bacterium]|nr:hypothetical protein [Deltaproteobacteria bacterium]